MFELSVTRTFRASHAILTVGEREVSHQHEWRVEAVVAGDALDGDGLLMDFHELERRVDAIIAPFDGGDVNATPPFDVVNPTAEEMARHVGVALGVGLPTGVRLERVSVTEAPGCVATYRREA